jgi:hypothetical protein
METSLHNIPGFQGYNGVDFDELDLRFLPYYMTRERVQITYKDKSTVKPAPKSNCYIDLCQYLNDRDNRIFLVFERFERITSKHGKDIYSDEVESIQGLGMHRPPPAWSIRHKDDDCIGFGFDQFLIFKNSHWGPWAGHEPLMAAMKEFEKEYF